jgi:hypothetical protein
MVECLPTLVDINESKSKEGKTGAYLAAFHGHLDVVKYLLGKGANEEDVWEAYKCKDGDTPFHTACTKGNLKDVKVSGVLNILKFLFYVSSLCLRLPLPLPFPRKPSLFSVLVSNTS